MKLEYIEASCLPTQGSAELPDFQFVNHADSTLKVFRQKTESS
jgi:hypothetical protein